MEPFPPCRSPTSRLPTPAASSSPESAATSTFTVPVRPTSTLQLPRRQEEPREDEKPLECSVCGSDEHLRAFCPKKKKFKGKGQGKGFVKSSQSSSPFVAEKPSAVTSPYMVHTTATPEADQPKPQWTWCNENQDRDKKV